MVFSDTYKFAFVHIPKCAGSSVKAANKDIDTDRFFSGSIRHDELGVLNEPLSIHPPVSIIKNYFPDYFEKLLSYESFTVVRDPYERFFSAVTQRAREFHALSSADLSVDRLKSLADAAIAHLESNDITLDNEYVHFIPQCDYVFIDGDQVVKNIDLPGDFRRLDAFFIQHGLNPVGAAANVTVEPQSKAFRHLARVLKPIYRTVLPARVKHALWRKLIDVGVYQKRLLKTEAFRNDPSFSAFIESYYRRDIELLEEVTASNGLRSPTSIQPFRTSLSLGGDGKEYTPGSEGGD